MKSEEEIRKKLRGFVAKEMELKSELQDEDLNETDHEELQEDLNNVQDKTSLLLWILT